MCGREMLAGHDLTHLTSSSVTLLQSHLKQPCSRGVEIPVCLSVVLDFLFFFVQAPGSTDRQRYF